MNINVRQDSVEIEGYVNAIERNSKPLFSRMGRFIERICKGAFKKALKRNEDVHILLNHDWNRDLGSTKKGNLDLEEDNIGLKARATITDKDVVEKAKNGDLVGWSFGFSDVDVDNTVENGMPTRAVKDLDLYEVSILDREKTPAYEGNLINARDAGLNIDHLMCSETFSERNIEEKESAAEQGTKAATAAPQTPENDTPKIDYSACENLIKEMKG